MVYICSRDRAAALSSPDRPSFNYRLDTAQRSAIFSTAPHRQHWCRWARQRHQCARIRVGATGFWRAFTGRVLVCSISPGLRSGSTNHKK